MKLLKETLGWAYLAAVMTLFIFAIGLYVEPVQAQVPAYEQYKAPLIKPLYSQSNRQPNTRPYVRKPNTVPYGEVQGTTHYQVNPNYSYGTMNGQDYSVRKYGNTTYIEAGDKSVTCQTTGNYTWCE